MNLSEAELETTVKVVKIRAQGELRRRFFDLGIVDGGSANKHFSEAGNEFISWGIEAFLKSC